MILSQGDINRRVAIKDLVESPLFNEIFDSIEMELLAEMKAQEDSTKRDACFFEIKAVDKFKGRLVAMANEIRMLKTRENEKDV